MPYTDTPLPLFTELHRIVRPGGTLAVTFCAPPPASSTWAQQSTCDPQSASLAWLQAADGADLLYMVGSFFYYSAEWGSIEVEELLPHSAANPAPLYAVTARKMSNRELFVHKASKDVCRQELLIRASSNTAVRLPLGADAASDTDAAAAATHSGSALGYGDHSSPGAHLTRVHRGGPHLDGYGQRE